MEINRIKKFGISMDHTFLRKFAYHIYQYLKGNKDIYHKVLFVGKYDEILKIFLSLSEYICALNMLSIEIESERYCGYTDEFIIEIDSDLNIICVRAKTDDGYPCGLEADIAFVMDNCDIEILSSLSDCSLICECKPSDDAKNLISTYLNFVWG